MRTLIFTVFGMALAPVCFAQPQIEIPRERPLVDAPLIDEGLLTPRCRPVEPEEPVCPGDDAEEYVVVVNRLACSGDCDLGRTEIRFQNASRSDARGAVGPRFTRAATSSILKGYRFSEDGFYFEVLFDDESYVMLQPITVTPDMLNRPQLRAVAVSFPSGKEATISWDFTVYPVWP
ncbi:hypothetical protein PUV54_07790 [Hyphococcus flavus]|uniref:Secreted protein n=1 Tax=Hyphococcus flavus TaxID=1866326 RepID=A0AAE9ZL14_9PROT|nr:hypothetical protein [Hyphococcus flavus]WDI33096.1 hypothetical protein PUV54_07790 [Hyphococcus flavus]